MVLCGALRKVLWTLSLRGRRSRNKVSVGEPAEGSFTLFFWRCYGIFISHTSSKLAVLPRQPWLKTLTYQCLNHIWNPSPTFLYTYIYIYILHTKLVPGGRSFGSITYLIERYKKSRCLVCTLFVFQNQWSNTSTAITKASLLSFTHTFVELFCKSTWARSLRISLGGLQVYLLL